jgi:hypothetical protein
MTIRKVLLYCLIIPIVLCVLFSIPLIIKKDLLVLWLILFILPVWGIGVFIGIIICAIIQKKRAEAWFYITGQVIAFGSVIIFALYQRYLTETHELRFGNIEHNHSFVDLNGDTANDSLLLHPEYIKTAFIKLEAEFDDPNSFHLTSYFTTKKDTALSTYAETVHTVYFAYNTNENKRLFSKVSVLENKAFMEIFNGDALHHGEYKLLKAKNEQWSIEQTNEFIKALKELPDSTKQQLRESLEGN